MNIKSNTDVFESEEYLKLRNEKINYYQNLSTAGRIILGVRLCLFNITEANITRCPYCSHLTWADKYKATMFGWSFIAVCHRCGNQIKWDDYMI